MWPSLKSRETRLLSKETGSATQTVWRKRMNVNREAKLQAEHRGICWLEVGFCPIWLSASPQAVMSGVVIFSQNADKMPWLCTSAGHDMCFRVIFTPLLIHIPNTKSVTDSVVKQVVNKYISTCTYVICYATVTAKELCIELKYCIIVSKNISSRYKYSVKGWDNSGKWL
jgi:hypothetical protein